jgi:hypothetical protein
MAALPLTGITTSMVASAIGAATNDVGSLCKHPDINMMAINKPTKYPSVSTNVWQTGIINQDYYDGVENYGIRKPYNLVPENATKIGQAPRYSVGSLSSIKSLWQYIKPTGGSLSPYRLGDFRGYEHRQLLYPYSVAKIPVSASPSAFRIGDNILISCTFRYDKDDYNGLLGLDKIFKLTSATGAPYSGLYFGVVAKTTDRNGIPQLAPCFTSAYSLTGMGNYDSNTGSNYTDYVSFIMPLDTNVIYDTSADPSKFHIGETIEIIPVVAAYTGSVDSYGNPYMYVYSLHNEVDNIRTATYDIPTVAAPVNSVQITSASFTVLRTAAQGYDSTYNAFQLNNLTINISKAATDEEIEFLENISIFPTSSVNVAEIHEGFIKGIKPLPYGTTTATLGKDIITNYGSAQPYKPYTILRTTAPIELSIVIRYKKFGSQDTMLVIKTTVPAI